ncbi:MAG: PD40 domain-containing protein [Ignavibacteriales bacterium]|nr:PD40 domain-containing protein [Ignavibacteriales bacterium]
MKKIWLFSFILPFLVLGQQVKIVDTKQITEAGDYFYPRFSKDNSTLFVSSNNYDGIRAINIETKAERVINNYSGAGWDYVISEDGNNLLCRPYAFIDGMKYYSIISQNLTDLSENVLEKDIRNLSSPMLSKEGISYIKEGSLESSEIIQNLSIKENVFVYWDNWNIIIDRNGNKKEYKPFGDEIYIWISLSPDKLKFLFTLGNKGTFIADLDGNILVELGKDVQAPKWSPDGNWIVYMNQTDDGVNYVTSEIWVVNSMSGNKIQLTNTDNVIEMYPEWSNDGKMITYNSTDGQIFISNLSFE